MKSISFHQALQPRAASARAVRLISNKGRKWLYPNSSLWSHESVLWNSVPILHSFTRRRKKKKNQQKKAHPEKQQINRNSKGVQMNALLKRELLVLNFSFQFLISSSAITFTHQQEITCGEQFFCCYDGPALN